MKKNLFRVFSLIIMLALCFQCFGCNNGQQSESPKDEEILTENLDGSISFDFSKTDTKKTQYIKKFDQFSTTWGFVSQPGYTSYKNLQAISAADDLKAESMRVDLFMGYTGIGKNIASNPVLNGTTDAEYAQAMQVMRAMKDNNVRPQLVYFANPAYSQDYAMWNSVPNAEKWQEVCANISAYMQKNGIRVSAHEIWNEPDLGNTYFAGDWQDYINTYIAGAKGIKSTDPDATVLGVSASWIHLLCQNLHEEGGTLTQFEEFIKQTDEQNIIPDAISWHFYGRECKLEDIKGLGGDGENFSVYRNAILNSLTEIQNGTSALGEGYDKISTLQQYLNEFNIYQPLADDVFNKTDLIGGMFAAMDTLLNANDITRVNWACFLSEYNNGMACGIIDSVSLQRYPAYHTCWAYGRLPLTRIEQPDLGSVKSLAGFDDGRASVIMYNETSEKADKKISFKNLPYKKGNVKVYLTDKDHLTYQTVNEPYLLAEYKDVELEKIAVEISLIPNSMCYVEIENPDGVSDLDVLSKYYNNVARKDYYYPNRGDNTPYSDIFENSLTAIMSMNDNDLGKTAMSVTLKDMAEVDELSFSVKQTGTINAGEDAAAGIKIDYQTNDGYTKSCYYYFDNYSNDMLLPFGTGVAADVIEQITVENGKFNLPVLTNAPDGWNGKIMVSYLMQNMGAGATYQISILN